MTIATAADVLAFWRAAGEKKWFAKDDAFDAEIKARFLATYEAAARGALSDWEATPEGALALVIVLDQFPRNMFRRDARTFAADADARAVADRALARGFDAQVPGDEPMFFYLPFEHSEAMADQERCCALFRAHGQRRPAALGRAARRHHPPLRPLPASQRRARPHHHAGRKKLSRQRRLRRLICRSLEKQCGELGRPPLPIRERDGARGLRSLDRFEPPHPNPLPSGERGHTAFAARFAHHLISSDINFQPG